MHVDLYCATLVQRLGALEAFRLRGPKVTVLVARTCKSPRAAERR